MNEYEQQKKLLELRLKLIREHSHDHYQRAQNYTNIIIAAGYAAFFAVLTNISGDLTPETRIHASISMGFSCTVFVLWELFKMVYVSYYIRRLYLACAHAQTDDEYNSRLKNLQEFEEKFNSSTGRLWVFVLVITIIPGLYGAFTLMIGGIALF